MLSVICPEAMTANLLITAILWHISNKNKINQTIKMKLENLKLGIEILSKIEHHEKHIASAKIALLSTFEPRVTRIRINGVNDDLEVPKNIFKMVCKMVLVEHESELSKLKEDLEKL
jgi:hypothetical protein